jgi:hypothetical protein
VSAYEKTPLGDSFGHITLQKQARSKQKTGVLSKDFASASTERRLKNEESTNASREMNLLRRRSLEFGENRETLQGRQGTRRAELSQPRDSPNRRISDLTAADFLLTSGNRASQALKTLTATAKVKRRPSDSISDGHESPLWKKPSFFWRLDFRNVLTADL